jgi:hypothetical protein
MERIYSYDNYLRVIFDWSILNPDLFQPAISVMICAVYCHQLRSCLTFGVMMKDAKNICQMSKRKATCMEKRDAFRYPGSRIYQKKVTKNTIYTESSPKAKLHMTQL